VLLKEKNRRHTNVASPIPPNIKMVGYPWRDYMKLAKIKLELNSSPLYMKADELDGIFDLLKENELYLLTIVDVEEEVYNTLPEWEGF
jgi:hypothetical protein